MFMLTVSFRAMIKKFNFHGFSSAERLKRVVFPLLAALLSLVFCNRQTGVHSWAIMTSIPSPTQGSGKIQNNENLKFLDKLHKNRERRFFVYSKTGIEGNQLEI